MDYHHHARLTVYSPRAFSQKRCRGAAEPVRSRHGVQAQPPERCQMGSSLPASRADGFDGSIQPAAAFAAHYICGAD